MLLGRKALSKVEVLCSCKITWCEITKYSFYFPRPRNIQSKLENRDELIDIDLVVWTNFGQLLFTALFFFVKVTKAWIFRYICFSLFFPQLDNNLAVFYEKLTFRAHIWYLLISRNCYCTIRARTFSTERLTQVIKIHIWYC